MKNIYLKLRDCFHLHKSMLLVIGFLMFNALQSTVLAQDKTITINLTNVTVANAMKEIEKVSGYKFVYNNKEVNTTRNVTVHATNEPLKTVVEKILPGYKVSIQGKSIVLTVEKKALAVDKTTGNLERFVIGKVTDAENDEPMIGVVVKSKGTNRGVITDLNGKFSIKVSGNKDFLEFNMIGYKPQEVPVEDRGVVNVQLSSTNLQLSEAVVVGAGLQKKISVTGAITSIKGMDLKMPSSSLTNALAGELAGVISQTSSGQPGSVSEFYIRGIGTFGGRATPLILLDDVEITATDLNYIPPETIESFSILKDASATAIYGSRGANGVMLIKTKTGNPNERTSMNVTLESSINQPLNFPNFVDGATWMELYNEALLTRHPKEKPKYSQMQIDNTRNHVNQYVFPDVNWKDVIFRDYSTSQRANLNMQGGGSKVTYFMSIQANHDTGILNSYKAYSWNNNIDNWGYSFQNNIGYKVTPTTTIDLRMNTQIRQWKGGNYNPSTLFGAMLNSNPINFPVTFPAQPGDKHIRFGSYDLGGYTFRTNIYSTMLNSFKETRENTINTSVRLYQDFKFITKGLSGTILMNFKNWSNNSYNQSLDPYIYHVKDNSYKPATNTFEVERLGTDGTEYINQSDVTKNGDQTVYLQSTLDYNRRWGQHTVGATFLYTQREYKSAVLPNRNQGYSGRVTYNYGNRYLGEVNWGYTGTERLEKAYRFEFFPAISLGWVPSEESFFTPVKNVLSFMKIRGSYGLIGSDETGSSYGHFLYVNSVNLTGGGSFRTGEDQDYALTGPAVTSYAIAGARWEKAKKLNIGMDLELFNSLNVTIDYFYDRRYDILMERRGWPSSLAYVRKPWANRGKVDNFGMDMSVNYNKQITKDLRADFRFNLTANQNKYVDLDDPNYPYEWQLSKGRPLNFSYGLVAEGLFKSQEEIDNSPDQTPLGSRPMPGDIKYRDVNGDGKIDMTDRPSISPYNGFPLMQYGIGVSLTYKRFNLGVFFNGSAKRTIFTGLMNPFNTTDNAVFQFIADNRWTEANPDPNAKYPRLGLLPSETNNNNQQSTFWMHDGSFMRFKLLDIGYRFKGGRIFFSSTNLFVFSKFKQWDPELSWNSYPFSRVYNLGLQLNF